MKRRMRLILSALFLAGALVTGAVTAVSAARIPAPVVLRSEWQATSASSDNGYIVRTYNGHIAVFLRGDDTAPLLETAIDVGALRAVDREKLSGGIEADRYEDVLHLLEDFGS